MVSQSGSVLPLLLRDVGGGFLPESVRQTAGRAFGSQSDGGRPMSLEARERVTAAAVTEGEAPPLQPSLANNQQTRDTARPLAQGSGQVAKWPEMGESAETQRQAEKAGEGIAESPTSFLRSGGYCFVHPFTGQFLCSLTNSLVSIPQTHVCQGQGGTGSQAPVVGQALNRLTAPLCEAWQREVVCPFYKQGNGGSEGE